MKRWRRHRVVVAILIVFVVWSAAAAWLLVSAVTDARHGVDHLAAARRDTRISALIDGPARRQLQLADRDFAAARRSVRNPLLAAVRVLPVVGRQVRAADHMSAAARSAVTITEDGLESLYRLAEDPVPAGQARVRLVQTVGQLATTARRRLAAIDAGSGKGLVPSLDSAHQALVRRTNEAVAGLLRAQRVAHGLAELLQGPRRYLLLGANNAEMRAGSGMFLSASPIDVGGGRLRLGDVRPTDQLVLPPGSVAPAGDLARNWSWLDPGRDFRNIALTADFPVSARLAAGMWRLEPGGSPVDGVVAIDVDGVRALLRAVGPVVVDGVRYEARTVREQLLHAQYRNFDGDRQARRDRLGDVARAVFQRLERGHWKLDRLATELVDAAAGRHLLLWSADDDAQRAWRDAGVDGRLTARSVGVSLLNRGANKLDFFVRQGVRLRTRTVGSDTVVTATVALRNAVPAGEPRYVAGPNAAELATGEYAGIVVVNAPRGALGLAVGGGAYTTFAGTDGPTQATGVYVRIPPGGSITLRISFRLPGPHGAMVLEPTGGVPGASVHFNARSWRIDRRRTLRW